MISTYKTSGNINENLFCKYTGMEILHRSFGKWIDCVKTANQKIQNIKIGLSIFDLNISTTDDLLTLLNEEL